MIYVNRNKKDDNGNKIRPSKNWFVRSKSETDEAMKEGVNHKFKDNIYSCVEVRAALEKLFEYKCAYCEGSIENQDWGVEHYRPKGGVADNRDHPGYYWLAYVWKNLFPSCQHCNGIRIDKPIWDDMTKGDSAGKSIKFPLEKEESRAMSHEDNIKREIPLLLCPCKDRPEKYLTFDITGQIITIKGKLRGEKSIEILHLKRRRLKIRRKKLIDKIKRLIELNRLRNKHLSRREVNKIDKAIIKNFCNDDDVYAAVARAMYNDPRAFGL